VDELAKCNVPVPSWDILDNSASEEEFIVDEFGCRVSFSFFSVSLKLHGVKSCTTCWLLAAVVVLQ